MIFSLKPRLYELMPKAFKRFSKYPNKFNLNRLAKRRAASKRARKARHKT